MQFSELAALFGSFQTIRRGAFPVHGGDRRLPARARLARALGAAKPGRHGHRRPGRWMTARSIPPNRRPKSNPRTDAVTRCPYERARHRSSGRAEPIDQSVLTQNRALVDDINRRNVLRGAHQPRRAVAVDRLRRQRRRFGAESAARGVGMERPRPGDDLPAATIWRRPISAVAGGQAAAVQRLLRHRRRQADRRRDLEAGTRRPHRQQAAVDRAADLPAARAGR